MSVRVWVSDEGPLVLEAGEDLPFGREEGAAQLAPDDPTVSRRHGVIHASEGSWGVTATGSRLGLVLYDQETPSRLHVPRGAGPVAVPFARCSLVIESRHARHALTVHGPGAAGWTGAWSSVLTGSADEDATGMTVSPWAGVRWRDGRSDKPLRWYRTLVALCEPYLSDPPEEVVRSDAELAARLGTTANVVQSRLIAEVRDALGFDRFTPQLRQTLVSVALSQGLVTRDDLLLLDLD